MNVGQLTSLLEANPKAMLKFVLPNGDAIPQHFHLTEVGRVEKNFIDCGGTKRQSVSCLLQLWTADDFDHRLVADKLLSILKLASPLLQSDELTVEIEYGEKVAATYTIGNVVSAFGAVCFTLLGKQTDCLAKDKCGVDACCDSQTCC